MVELNIRLWLWSKPRLIRPFLMLLVLPIRIVCWIWGELEMIPFAIEMKRDIRQYEKKQRSYYKK